jgi:hypothetical protein
VNCEQNEISMNEIEKLIELYVSRSKDALKNRWVKWKFDMSQRELHEVVGGLLARQVTLSNGMALNPGIWNEHLAPIFLRCMADVYINLAWICKDPQQRAKKFIEYGLGQLKLEIEHRKKQLRKDAKDPDSDIMIKSKEELLNSQKLTYFTDVELGHWAESNTRRLAEEAGCIDFYNYVYVPFSSAVHSTWKHILQYSLTICKNPLHRGHYVPIDMNLPSSLWYLDLSAKYLDKTFKIFDNTFDVEDGIYVYSFLGEMINEIKEEKLE